MGSKLVTEFVNIMNQRKKNKEDQESGKITEEEKQ